MVRVMDTQNAGLSPRVRKRLLQMVLKARRDTLNGHSAPAAAQALRDLEDQLVWMRVLEHDPESRMQLQEAAQLVRAGRYGLCSMCGKQIPASRLNAIPIAVRCLPCQAEYERTLGEMRVAAA